MNRLLVTLAMSLVAMCAAVAQEFSVSGRVVDAANAQEGLPSASVLLMKNDTASVAGVATDEKGFFNIGIARAGTYRLRVSFVGYIELEKRVAVTAEKPHVNVGALMLAQDEKMLKELQVTGIAQELTIKADTFVYHANAFRVPEGATIAALIKQLPGLSMDSDGNLTFQGKAVSSILVNGKSFIGDAATAMSNIVSDAVKDVAVYEKSDEELEFAGVYDTDKATVVDLKIKEEYMSSWNVNADAGAGTHDKYMAKVFALNFTDRRRAAVYAQVNNISEDQIVDENGNWSNAWGFSDGIYTYRKAGAIFSWDNGRQNTDAGMFKFNAELQLGHDNSSNDAINNSVMLLGSAGNHYSYQRAQSSGRQRNARIDGNITYNIDSLNRLTAMLLFYHYNARNGSVSNSSTYSAAADFDNPETGLIGSDICDELKALGINSQARQTLQSGRQNSFTVDTRYTRRFRKEGYSLEVGARYKADGGNSFSNTLCDYRYFNTSAPASFERRYYEAPDNSNEFEAQATLSGLFGKYIMFSVTYRLRHKRNDNEELLYRLDRYAHYAQPGLSIGQRPSTADSLAAVMDIENSLSSDNKELMQSLRLNLSGVWEKFEARAGGTFSYYDEELNFERAGKRYSPERNYLDISPFASLRWKPVKNGEISMYYYGYSYRPSLVELLPITDTSNQMVERVNNPGLELQWNNNLNLYSRWFNEKRGDSYHIYANYGVYMNSVVNIMETDPMTGKMRYTKENVNGCYDLSFGVGSEHPLDSERHWTLSSGVGYRMDRRKNFVGTLDSALGLSVVHSYSPRANFRLSWRSGIWSVNLSGACSAELARYDNAPQYNQNGYTYEWNFEPQAELPFGMKVYTSFGLYGRSGYGDDIMNHNQWLWNLTVSQSLLKNKVLTLQLEAVDILRQRTSEYNQASPEMLYYNRNKVFMSYVMLHAIYRFNIGGK